MSGTLGGKKGTFVTSGVRWGFKDGVASTSWKGRRKAPAPASLKALTGSGHVRGADGQSGDRSSFE